MKTQDILTLIGGSISLFVLQIAGYNSNFLPAPAAAHTLQTKSDVRKLTAQPISGTFVQQCQQRKSLPVETRHTIDVLLSKVGTKDCKLAFGKLNSLITLDLMKNQIVDLKPLATLTNLTYLSLEDNKIVDVKSLATLTNLEALGLGGNQIVDVKPLTTLTHLTNLGLYSNKIVDVKPLATLTNLEVLNLFGNQVVDVKPLTTLTHLTDLRLESNRISFKSCPVKPESICSF